MQILGPQRAALVCCALFVASVALGDRLADRERFHRGLRGPSPLVAYGELQRGWSLFREGDLDAASKTLQAAARHAGERRDGGVELRAEALRDLAMVFAEREETDEAVAYYSALPIPLQRAGLETIAAIALDGRRYEDVIQLEERLLALDPDYQGNPRYELTIVHALELSKRKEAAAMHLFDRLPRYVKGSRWFVANELMPRATRDAATLFEESGRALALALDSRKTYERYLAAFPSTPYAPDLRSRYAQAVWRQGERASAGEQYFRSYQELAGRPAAQESLRGSLIAFEAAMNDERASRGLAPVSAQSRELLKEDAEAMPLATLERRFVDVGDEYLKRYPHASEVPDVLYEEAYLFYLHHDFDRAFPRLKPIWQRHYTSRALFEAASDLSIDILERKRDYAALSLLCRELLRLSAAGSDLRARVAVELRRSEMKRIDAIERGGDLREAAREYVGYATELGPQDESLHELALHGAGIDFTRAGAYADAVTVEKRFLAAFPKSPRAAEVWLALARNDEWLADLSGAAEAFERFVSLAPTHPQARSALRWAAIYWSGAGKPERATQAMERYAALAAEPGAERELAEFYEHHGAIEKAIALELEARAKQGISPVESAERAVRVAELTFKSQGKLPEALLRDALALAKKGPAPQPLLSKLAFWAAGDATSAFETSAPVTAATLGGRARQLESLEKAYEPVVAMGGEWGLGAIYRMARASARLARELAEAKLPAATYADKAKSLAVQCLEKAREDRLLTLWSARCYQLAAELDPAHYPGAHTLYIPPVRTAVLEPAARDLSSIEPGNAARSVYPYFSSVLFRAGLPTPPSDPLAGPAETREPSAESGLSSIPEPMTYRLLAETRRAWIARSLESSPQGTRRTATFSYLNLLRVSRPDEAIALLREAIRRSPEEPALHNLLALAYLETNRLEAAKATWLSLVARGADVPAVWNNLGVVAYLEGRERDALDAFKRAGQGEHPATEAWSNLGFLALRYHIPEVALTLFEKAGQAGEDVMVQVGAAQARLQAGEGLALKDTVESLVVRYEDDPYARITAAHYLLDVERHREAAKKFMRDYLDAQPGVGDGQFAKAMREAMGGATKGEIVSAGR